jgi:hypothetical protein
MRRYMGILFVLMIVVSAFFVGQDKTQAASVLRSFGGRVTSVIPCISPLGPALWISIVPAGVFPVSYIWTPATITKLDGPPTHVGQQVLGLADVPFACWNVTSGGLFGLFDVFSYLYGLRITTIGTGL